MLENLHDPSNLIDPFLAMVAGVPAVCLAFFVLWQRSFVSQPREMYGFDASMQKLEITCHPQPYVGSLLEICGEQSARHAVSLLA